MNKSILIVDDNLTICLMLKSWLVKKDFKIETATNVNDAKQMIKEQPFDLILSDIKMPDVDGFTFLSWVKKFDSDIIVIMMTGFADIESAVASMKSGAADFISKPIEPEELFRKIEEAFMMHENRQRRNRFCNEFILPPGEEYYQLLNQLDTLAENKAHLLIIGDRGTGKNSIVKYIHDKGFHLCTPLVKMDVEGLSNKNGKRQLNNPEASESLLMEKFREAKGGLLSIRNVDQLDINLQDELLNILTRQNRDDNFTQVIVTTEKRDVELQKILIPKLYHLLEKNCVVLPSLKGKKQVIVAFISYFIRFANFTLDKNIESIDPKLQQQLVDYAWPGNIQELKNMIMKAALHTEGTHITAKIAPDLFGRNNTRIESGPATTNPIHKLRKENYEKEKIMEALELARGNKTMAASILNIDRKTLYNKMKLYNVSL
ncbi:MAG: sigma-54-dependent Fis family transcriptional regulator [Bacteroidales bacterium]|jgi:two-component system response regulator HydG|nr:sigma-54-dependent Fis family transcriptional regulator [Bacteroidales bacterium]